MDKRPIFFFILLVVVAIFIVFYAKKEYQPQLPVAETVSPSALPTNGLVEPATAPQPAETSKNPPDLLQPHTLETPVVGEPPSSPPPADAADANKGMTPEVDGVPSSAEVPADAAAAPVSPAMNTPKPAEPAKAGIALPPSEGQ